MTSPPRSSPSSGFSLLELLVSVVLLMLLMVLLFTLFGMGQRAMRQGMSQMEVVGGAHIFDDRLRRDADGMLGPSSVAGKVGGTLIIVPATRRGDLPLPGGRIARNILLRSDQLAFLYNAKGGGVAGLGGSKLPSLVDPTQPDRPGARIWYGHILQAGSTPADATSWMLGRQASVFTEPASSMSPILLPPNPTDDRANTDLVSVANEMRTVWRTGQLIGTGPTVDGLTDNEVVNRMAVLPRNPGGAIDSSNYANQPQILSDVLADHDLTFGELAAEHMLLMDHCSEIEVQYAGDFNRNGMMDTVTPAGLPTDWGGPIRWYPDAKDIYAPTTLPLVDSLKPMVFRIGDDQKRLIHIGYVQDGITQGSDSTKPGYQLDGYPYGTPSPNPSLYIIPSLSNIPAAQSGWPRLIRIRLRLHDLSGAVFTLNEELETNGRDDDGDGVVDNPGESRAAGIWFEYIIAVPYPPSN